MEELKVPAVTGAVPVPSLSAYYFLNLCIETLEEITPSLISTFRVRLGEQFLPGRNSTPETLAIRKAALVLMRLLALVMYDKLPPMIQPEGIERAMQFALDNLPASLQTVLQAEENEAPLSPEQTVRVHHLFRRLTQLRCGEDRQRSERLIELLLESRGRHWGGTAPQGPRPKGPLPLLLLNPDGNYATTSETLENAPRPILAATALLRALTGQDPVVRQVADIFSLDGQQQPGSVWGALDDGRIPDAARKQVLTASLRLSWPARRLPLPTRTPQWVWEWLHVLGLCQSGAHVTVALPDDWLTADYGAALYSLLKEQFTLLSLRRLNERLIELSITKTEGDVTASVLVEGVEESRSLPWGVLQDSPLAILVLALEAPSSVWGLLEDEKLQFLSADHPVPSSEALLRYFDTSLGSFLWETVSGGSPQPKGDVVAETVCRAGLPLPSPAVFRALETIEYESSSASSSSALDHELEQWLGAFELPAEREVPSKTVQQRRSSLSANRRNKLLTQICDKVFRDGVPQFPEHYLYGYLHPALIDYRFSGSLKTREAFFGQITLTDETGAVLLVEGEATAKALVLTSAVGRNEVALPADQQLAADILDRYLADLKRLHQTLARLVYAEIAERRSAGALIDRIWNNQALPPWPLIGEDPLS